MNDKTVYELVFTAKNNASAATKQVAAEVGAVKAVAAEAKASAETMKSAYEQAIGDIGADMSSGTSEIRKQISIQRKVIQDLRKEYQSTVTKYDQAPTNFAKKQYGSQLTQLRDELAGEKQALLALEQAQTQYKESTTSLRTQLTNLRNEMAQMRIDGKADTSEYAAKRQEFGKIATAYREVQAEQKALEQAQTQYSGSTASLRTQLANLRNEMAQLQMDGKADTAEYAAKRQEFGKIATAYREVQAEQKALEQGQRQYSGSTISLRSQLTNLRNEMAQMRIDGKADTAEYAVKRQEFGRIATAYREVQAEQKALEQAQTQYSGSTTSLRTQLTNLRNEMVQLRMDGKADTAEYEAKRQQMEKLGTAYRELQTEQQALSTGATQWGGAIAGLQGLIGLYSAGSGVVSLFVKDNKQLQAIQTKLQATMSIMMGMQQLSNTLHATSAFRIVTVRKVTDLWRMAQNKMTGSLVVGSVAAKAFWGAVSLGATVVIGAAIAAVSRWINKNRELREQAEATKKKLKEANDSAQKTAANSVSSQITNYRKLQAAWNALGNDLAAKGRFVKGHKAQFTELGVAIRNTSDAENLLVTNESVFIESLYKRATAMAAMELAAQQYKTAIETLLAAESKRTLTPDETQSAMKAGTAAVNKKHKLSSTVWRSNADFIIGRKTSAVPEIQAWAKTYSDAYNAAVDKIMAGKKAKDEAAFKKSIAEGNKRLKEGLNLTKEVKKDLAAGNIISSDVPLPTDNTKKTNKYLLKLSREREDAELSIQTDGLNKRLAALQLAHDRWLSDARTECDAQVKLAGQNTKQVAAINDGFNALILSKDKELKNDRVNILKQYSNETLREYLKQTGDLKGFLEATSGNGAIKPKPIPAPKTPQQGPQFIDSKMVASIKVRLEGIEEAKRQIAALRDIMKNKNINLTGTDRQNLYEQIGMLEDYVTSMGGVVRAQRKTGQSADEAATALGAIGNVVGSTSGLVNDQAASWVSWSAGIIGAIGAAIPQIAALVIAQHEQATANAAAAGTGAAASVASIPIVGWIMAGTAVASVVTAMASIPKFADGGLAYGTTLGVFGEYPGAQNNPEVVAPLDRLRSLIQPSDGTGGRVMFKIAGRYLVGLLEKESKYNLRTR